MGFVGGGFFVWGGGVGAIKRCDPANYGEVLDGKPSTEGRDFGGLGGRISRLLVLWNVRRDVRILNSWAAF